MYWELPGKKLTRKALSPSRMSVLLCKDLSRNKHQVERPQTVPYSKGKGPWNPIKETKRNTCYSRKGSSAL